MKSRALYELQRMSNQSNIPPNRTLLYFFSIGIPTASLNQSTTLCRDWYTESYPARKHKNVTSNRDNMNTRKKVVSAWVSFQTPPQTHSIAANLITHELVMFFLWNRFFTQSPLCSKEHRVLHVVCPVIPIQNHFLFFLLTSIQHQLSTGVGQRTATRKRGGGEISELPSS